MDRDWVQRVLSANLPWSPLDFIKEVSATGDRFLYAEKLTAGIDPEDDLRFISEGLQGEIGVFGQRLPWDSKFFGYEIARLDGVFPLAAPFYRPYADYTPILKELLIRAREKGIKYLFAHVDPRDLATLRGLGNIGFSVIETRVLYHMSLTSYEHDKRYPVRAATADDIASLGRVAAEAVNSYDRFHSDPFIKKEDADRLMRKWVEASIAESFADITLVPAVSNPGAFCTIKYHRDNWNTWNLKVAQPVFSAVSREFRGWYQKIISEVHYHLKQMGAEYSYYSTQTTNKAVIWVLEKLGYHFGRGELVLRIVL